jgi:hypothetical protein
MFSFTKFNVIIMYSVEKNILRRIRGIIRMGFEVFSLFQFMCADAKNAMRFIYQNRV